MYSIHRDFIKKISHSPCVQGNVESSDCYAYEVDGDAGLSQHLEFVNGTLSNVDYFCDKDDNIQLIELTDLVHSIEECNSNIGKMITEKRNCNGGNISSGEEKAIRKQAWKPITTEFNQKWSGSIAVIERLYRKNEIYDKNPKYQMLIILKDGTDPRMMDALKTRLSGMIRDIKICTTKDTTTNLISKIEPP